MISPKTWILWITALNLCPEAVGKCFPPSFPTHGYYAPEKTEYESEEKVSYSCKKDYVLFGNEHRQCQSNGQWSEETPFCDVFSNSGISSSVQSSTLDDHNSTLACDGETKTCSITKNNGKQNWTGYLKQEVFVFAIRIFLSTGPVALNVVLQSGSQEYHVCGTINTIIESHPGEWKILFCKRKGWTVTVKDNSVPFPQPVKLCEVQLITWKDGESCNHPPSADSVEGGKIEVSRKEAFLICNQEYVPDSVESIKCISGTWSKETLQCRKSVTEPSTSEVYNTTFNAYQDPKNLEKHSGINPETHRHLERKDTSTATIAIVATLAVSLGLTSIIFGCLAVLKWKRNSANSTTSTATMNTTLEDNEGPHLYELMLYEEIQDNTPTLLVSNKPTWGLPEIPPQESVTLDTYYSQPLEDNTSQPCCVYNDSDHSAPYVDTEPQDAYKDPSGICFGHTNCDRNIYTTEPPNNCDAPKI